MNFASFFPPLNSHAKKRKIWIWAKSPIFDEHTILHKINKHMKKKVIRKCATYRVYVWVYIYWWFHVPIETKISRKLIESVVCFIWMQFSPFKSTYLNISTVVLLQMVRWWYRDTRCYIVSWLFNCNFFTLNINPKKLACLYCFSFFQHQLLLFSLVDLFNAFHIKNELKFVQFLKKTAKNKEKTLRCKQNYTKKNTHKK